MMNINKIKEWSVSANNQFLSHISGKTCTKSSSISEGKRWHGSSPIEENFEFYCNAIRCYYHVNGLKSINDYICKYNLSNEQALSFINEETKTQLPLLESRKINSTTEIEQFVLNETCPAILNLNELTDILNEDAYCEPWIASNLRSALFKWKRGIK